MKTKYVNISSKVANLVAAKDTEVYIDVAYFVSEIRAQLMKKQNIRVDKNWKKKLETAIKEQVEMYFEDLNVGKVHFTTTK